MTVPPPIRRDLEDQGATAALAASLARLIRPGDVLALDGPLGAGKTTLTRALAAALGVDPALVASPTFVFVNQYPIPASSINATLRGGQVIHVDAYRLSGVDDLDSLGWDRLFDPDTRRAAGASVALVEWPGRIAPALPADAATLTLDPRGESARAATLAAPASWTTRPEFERFAAYAPIRCPTSGRWVEPLAPTWPFHDDRSRLADLYGWMTGERGSSRPIEPDDDERA